MQAQQLKWLQLHASFGEPLEAGGEFILARKWERKKQRDGVNTVHGRFLKNGNVFKVPPLLLVLGHLPLQRMEREWRSQLWVSVPEKA